MGNIIINNFTAPSNLDDLYDYFLSGGSNIDILLEDLKIGSTVWSIDKKAQIGDIVVFMCAKTARDKLGLASSHIPSNYSPQFISFINSQKSLYKKYSGCLLGIGVVNEIPKQDGTWWMSEIINLVPINNPVHISEFNDFITVSRTGSITKLTDSQWERLKWIIHSKNPQLYPNAKAPDKEELEKEFEEEVKKQMQLPLTQLENLAKKKSSKATATSSYSTVYKRNAIIAAYTKKRANGVCQLCGKPAPFDDVNGEPYLECHHVIWLSKGGMDSIDNCVALCPNCHRKMHLLNLSKDVNYLLNSIKP